MKLCAACCEELPQESFSKKQWQLKQYQRRCKECIDAGRDVQLSAPPKVEPAGKTTNAPSKEVEKSIPSPPKTKSKGCIDVDRRVQVSAPPKNRCWICLEEGPDESGNPLTRDCSCRGDAGFVHLSCIMYYAEQKSRTCFETDGNSMNDLMKPWEYCPNCCQEYNDQFAIDLASRFVTFVERDVQDADQRIYASALGYKLECLAEGDRDRNSDYDSDRLEEMERIAREILSIVRRHRKMYPPLTNRMLQLEAAAHYHIGSIYQQGKRVEKAIEHYEMSLGISKEANHSQGVAAAEGIIAAMKASQEGAENTMSREEEMEKVRNIYKEMLWQGNEESAQAIEGGISIAMALHYAHHAIEAERLISNIFTMSTRINGPEHILTRQAESELQRYKVRYISVGYDRDSLAFRALGYEDNGEKCYVYGPLKDELSTAVIVLEKKHLTVATNVVLPMVGTPVICCGLIRAKHLNGKIGDVRAYDKEMTGRCEVHFEDNSLKACLVKPENVRILFELPEKRE